MSGSQQLVEISSVPSLPLKQFHPSRNIRIEMLVAASEGLCSHKCPAWGGPWGHPARWEGGTKGLSPVLCPQVSPAVALGSCTHSLRSLCWFVNPRSPFSLQILLKAWPSRPGVMSLTQPPLPPPQPSSPAQSSPAPALEPNTNEASSRAALICYEPQVKRNNFFKIPYILPRQALPCH